VSNRTARSRSVAGIPTTWARYRIGPTSASAQPRSSTFAPLLVSDRRSSDWPAKPGRFIDGRIDLGDTPIKVGDCSTLDPEASFDVCGSVGDGKIYGCHVVEVGAREEAEHTDGVQPHQHADHQDQDEAQEGWRRGANAPSARLPQPAFRPPALRP
jgi:hypothetical protein